VNGVSAQDGWIDPAMHAVDPNAWERHMRRGDFTSAWKVCDAVMKARRGTSCSTLPRHQQWVWQGEPIDGKRVLVRCYHGLGDTIQFIRFAPMLRQRARRVVVWAQPALIPLLRTARGIDELIPLDDGAPPADYDVDVEVMELAHLLRVTRDSLPRAVPYLHVSRSTTLARSPDRFAVGITWACGDWGVERSVPVELLEPLARVPGVELHVLQRGAALDAWPPAWGPVSGSDVVHETAGTMRALDLVVTIDSMPAHLAGALGLPVWVLLQAHADWRWMDGREDSPWYPTMRLVRQPRAGDWAGAIARLATALAVAARAWRRAASLPSGSATSGVPHHRLRTERVR
jgi:hypothetical protein